MARRWRPPTPEPNPELHALTQFLGGYFHQDAFYDGASWQDCVAEYLSADGREIEAACERAIQSLRGEGLADEELTRRLHEVYGADYDPHDDGMTADQWLAAVQEMIREHLNRRGV